MKTNYKEYTIKEYIEKVKVFRCNSCGMGFLRIRKTKCPFCKSERVDGKKWPYVK